MTIADTSTDTGAGADGSVNHTSDRDATGVFSKSIMISAVRCLLAYVIFPFVAPAVGLAGGAEGVIGLIISLVAIAANVFSIRRFWAADHRWKIPISILNVTVIAMLTVLLIDDLRTILG